MILHIVLVTNQSWEVTAIWLGVHAAKLLLNPTMPTIDGDGVCLKTIMLVKAWENEIKILKAFKFSLKHK